MERQKNLSTLALQVTVDQNGKEVVVVVLEMMLVEPVGARVETQ